MNKSTIVIIIYIIGLIFGALFLKIWSADTSIYKGLLGLGWTALFLIGLFFPAIKRPPFKNCPMTKLNPNFVHSQFSL